MGLGECDETTFRWRTICNNTCPLKPETIEQICQVIVGEGHRLQPDAIANVRADSFVVETNGHYPTESSLLYDGLQEMISMCAALGDEHGGSGWRQSDHLIRKVKLLNRKINRIALKKGAELHEANGAVLP